jgi:hypothetical protein
MRQGSHELLRKLWNDPVWSKVIATLIADALLFALATLVARHLPPEVPKPWVIVSAVTPAAILLCALFILFRQTSRIITPGEMHRSPYYRAPIRRIALFGALIAAVLPVAVWAVSALHQRFPAADTALILVADFETRPTDVSYRVTRTIVQQLQEAASSYKDVNVLRLGRPIPWHDGIQTALRVGAERRAAIVIWGDFDTTPDSVIVSANIELIPGPGLRHRRGWNTATDKLSELHHFALQQRLSTEITYMTLFVLGLIHYNTGDVAGSIGL